MTYIDKYELLEKLNKVYDKLYDDPKLSKDWHKGFEFAIEFISNEPCVELVAEIKRKDKYV